MIKGVERVEKATLQKIFRDKAAGKEEVTEGYNDPIHRKYISDTVHDYVAKDDPKHEKIVDHLHKAIVEYLLNGTPPERTIRNATNILDFQFIAKTGRSYDKTVWRNGDSDDLWEVQRVNRVYASLEPDHGTLYKVKVSERRKDKIANLPDRCYIDNENQLLEASKNTPIEELIDLQFYIDMAHKRIQDFIGDQPIEEKTKEESKMTTKTAEKAVTTKGAEKQTFLQKLFELRKALTKKTTKKPTQKTVNKPKSKITHRIFK